MKKALRNGFAVLLAALMVLGGAPLAGIAGIEWNWPDFGWFDVEAGAQDFTPVTSVEYGGHTYALYDTPTYWNNARDNCIELGGHLAVITSAEEQAAIQGMLASGTKQRYWLGATDVQTEGTFKWTTGESLTYTNWDSGQPDNSGGYEHYLLLYKSSGKWNDSYINFDLNYGVGFICEFEDFFIPFKTVEQNGHIYSIYNDKYTWTQAEAFCVAMGGHLMTITSQLEQNIAEDLMTGAVKGYYWFGATDEVTEGTFQWVTGETFAFSNWQTGQPNNSGGVEDCGYLANDSNNFSKWCDAPNNTTANMGFICETDTSGYTPVQTLNYGGSVYSRYTNKTTWITANQYAKSIGGHLVTITSAEENQQMLNMAQSGPTDISYWLGAADPAQDRVFKWSNGEVLSYTKLYPGEPSNYLYREFFLEMRYDVSWWWTDVSNKGTMETGNGFIVEKEAETTPGNNIAVYDPNGGEYMGGSGSYTERQTYSGRYVRLYSSGSRATTDVYSETLIVNGIKKTHGSAKNPCNHYLEVSVNTEKRNTLRTPSVLPKSAFLAGNTDSYEVYSDYTKARFWTGGKIGLGTNTYMSDNIAKESPGYTYMNDGNATSFNYASTYSDYITIDLGSLQTISDINVWRYYEDGRGYFDCVILISADPIFDNNDYIVWNSDRNETWWKSDTVWSIEGVAWQVNNNFFYDFGEGKDPFYYETSAGKQMFVGPKNGQRYVVGNYNTIPTREGYNFAGWQLNGGEIYEQNDLIENWNSTTGTDVFVAQWVPKQATPSAVYNPNGGEYMGSTQAFTESQTYRGRYVRLYASGSKMPGDTYSETLITNGLTQTHGSTGGPANHYAEVEVYADNQNVLREPVTLPKTAFSAPYNSTDALIPEASKAGWWSTGISGLGIYTYLGEDGVPKVATNYSNINNGNYEPDKHADTCSSYVTMDLGTEYDISDMKVWRRYDGGRGYFDCVIVISKDPVFDNNDYILWNSDRNETWWSSDTTLEMYGSAWFIGDNFDYDFGAGKDELYYETAAGKQMFVGPKNGQRYVVGNYNDPPVREGYTFAGWQLNGGQVYAQNDLIANWNSATGSDTFVAQWIPHEYTLAYDANGGTGAPQQQIKVQDTDTALSTQLPQKARNIQLNVNGGEALDPAELDVPCALDNWNTMPDGSGTGFAPGAMFNLNGDRILYAQWSNPTAGNLPIPAKSGVTFDGWYTQVEGGSPVTSETVIDGDIEVFAHWRSRSVTNAQISALPVKTQYFVGDTIDTAGFSLLADYDNGESGTVTDGFVCSPMTLRRAGTQPITVTFEGKTVTFNVTVQAVELTGLSVLTPPLKTQYNKNEMFDSGGLTLTAAYNNGSTKTINSGFSAAYDFGSAGSKEVQITYTEGGLSAQTSLTVTVAVNNIVGGNPATADAGITVNIPVQITGNQGLMGFSLNIGYDAAAFTPVSVSAGSMLAGGMLNDSIATAQPGQFKVVWTGSQDVTGDGILFTVTFSVNANAIGAKNIALSYNQADTFNENWEDVVLHCGDIPVTVNNPNYMPPPALSAGPATVTAGDTIGLPVSIANSAGMSQFKIYLTYDPEIYTYVSVSKGAALLTGDIGASAAGGVLTVTWTGTSSDGVIFTPVFRTAEYKEGRHDIALSYDPANTVFATQGTVMTCPAVEVTLVNPFAGQSAWVQADHIQGAVGTTVNVPIRIFNNQGLMGFGITVHYDPAVLTPLAVTRGTVTAAGMFDSTLGPGSSGSFKVIWNNTGDVSANGTLMVVSFTVNPGAALGDSPITLTYTQADTFNEAWQDVSLDCRASAITVTDAPLQLAAKAGSATVIDRNNGLLYGLAPGMSVNDLLAQYLEAAPANTTIAVNGSVGTGTKVELIDTASGATFDSLTIVIFGDVNGDGNIDSSDAGIIVDYENFIIEFEPAEYAVFSAAADLNKDGNADSSDAGIVVDVENFLLDINQTTGRFLTL